MSNMNQQSNSLNVQQHSEVQKNNSQQATQQQCPTMLAQLKPFDSASKKPTPSKVRPKRPPPPSAILPGDTCVRKISLPIQENGLLEPVKISKQVPTSLMQSRHLDSKSRLIQQNQDILTSMLNQSSEQLEIAPNSTQHNASLAKTRIFSVMKHTPPCPPQPQVPKLPPMGTLAHSKPQIKTSQQTSTPQTATKKLDDQQPNQSKNSAQSKNNQNQSFLNQNLAASSGATSATAQAKQRDQPKTSRIVAKGPSPSSHQVPAIYDLPPSSNLTPLEDFLGRNSANSITFQGKNNNNSSTPSQDTQFFQCTQFSLRPNAFGGHFNQSKTSNLSFGGLNQTSQKASSSSQQQRAARQFNQPQVSQTMPGGKTLGQQQQLGTPGLKRGRHGFQNLNLGTQNNNTQANNNCNNLQQTPHQRQQIISDEILNGGGNSLNLFSSSRINNAQNVTPLPGAQPRHCAMPDYELPEEDYEFIQKLGTEFGNNSSSNPLFFSNLGAPGSNCEQDGIRRKDGSSSPSYSRDFDEDSFPNPNLLSILQCNKQGTSQPQQYRQPHPQVMLPATSSGLVQQNSPQLPANGPTFTFQPSGTASNLDLLMPENNKKLTEKEPQQQNQSSPQPPKSGAEPHLHEPAATAQKTVTAQQPQAFAQGQQVDHQSAALKQQVVFTAPIKLPQPTSTELDQPQPPQNQPGSNPQPPQLNQGKVAPPQGQSSNLQSMPATSATTTNHYIINNLNVIGTPGGSGGGARLPQYAVQGLDALLPMDVTRQTNRGVIDEVPPHSGYVKKSQLSQKNALQPKFEAFDLIMQDGKRANDFLSSLPPQSSYDPEHTEGRFRFGAPMLQDSEALGPPQQDVLLPVKTSKKGRLLEIQEDDGDMQEDIDVPVKSNKVLTGHQQAEGYGQYSESKQRQALCLPEEELRLKRQQSQKSEGKLDYQKNNAVLSSQKKLHSQSSLSKTGKSGNRSKKSLTDVKVKPFATQTKSDHHQAPREGSRSQRMLEINQQPIIQTSSNQIVAGGQDVVPEPRPSQEAQQVHHHHYYVIHHNQQGQQPAPQSVISLQNQQQQHQCPCMGSGDPEKQRLHLMKMLQLQMDVDKPLAYDLMCQYGLVKPRGGESKKPGDIKEADVVSAFNLFPRPTYNSGINPVLGGAQQSSSYYQKRNLPGETVDMQKKHAPAPKSAAVAGVSSKPSTQLELQDRPARSGILSQVSDTDKQSVLNLPGPPVIFKVERVLGVHRCPLSTKQIVRDFIQKYNCQALDGQLDETLRAPEQPGGVPERRVGKLTPIDRYLKVRRYLEKRQKRIWMKKVSYTIRKDHAEKRLRIKGRFIKREDQADIMQRIFTDEQLTQSNVQRLNQNLQDIVNSPKSKAAAETLLEPIAKEATKKEQALLAKKKQTTVNSQPGGAKKPEESRIATPDAQTKKSVGSKVEESKRPEAAPRGRKPGSQPKTSKKEAASAAAAQDKQQSATPAKRGRGRPPKVKTAELEKLVATGKSAKAGGRKGAGAANEQQQPSRKRDKKASAKLEATQVAAATKTTKQSQGRR